MSFSPPTNPGSTDPHDHEGRPAAAGPPFGLPVLAEVPELADLLSLAVDAERLTARLVEAIIVAEDAGLAATTTGVGLDQWLAVVARSTRSDRRMLLTAARVCRRLPAVRAGFADGDLSWSQVRTIALRTERLPTHLDDRLDAAIAHAMTGVAGVERPDPDALLHVLSWALAEADDADPSEEGEPQQDRLVLQPRLDGSGGRGWFDLGPVGFAAVDTATDPGPAAVPASRDGFGDDPDPDATRRAGRQLSQARAARLIDLCLRGGPGDVASDRAARPRPAPTLLLRAELDTLLGDERYGAQLLTTLAGGRMHVDSRTARRLVDRYGADLRLVLLDDGQVVGVGTKRRQPTGWLADAVLALHDTCTEPGCRTAARVCDLDHAVPVDDDGPTDVDNLAPLCRPANVRKERGGWRAAQTADGIRTWTHPASGLTTTTIPATWRPPPSSRGDPPGDPPLEPRPAGAPTSDAPQEVRVSPPSRWWQPPPPDPDLPF